VQSEVTVSSNMAHNLTLIINEIITNAIKHASPAKDDLIIRVEVESDDKNIILRIKDNGKGFPQSFLDGDFKGTGIGFELIFGIVKESLEGDVSIENNNGAVFNISVKKENV
jgi:two-component sensor histidine kinase